MKKNFFIILVLFIWVLTFNIVNAKNGDIVNGSSTSPFGLTDECVNRIRETGDYLTWSAIVNLDPSYEEYIVKYGFGYDTRRIESNPWELLLYNKIDYKTPNGKISELEVEKELTTWGYYGFFVHYDIDWENVDKGYFEAMIGDSMWKGTSSGWGFSTHAVELIYNANGGTGAPNSQIRNESQNLTLSDIIPQRDGYIFLGWALNPNATKADFNSSETYNYWRIFESNIQNQATLYAVWEKEPEVIVTPPPIEEKVIINEFYFDIDTNERIPGIKSTISYIDKGTSYRATYMEIDDYSYTGTLSSGTTLYWAKNASKQFESSLQFSADYDYYVIFWYEKDKPVVVEPKYSFVNVYYYDMESMEEIGSRLYNRIDEGDYYRASYALIDGYIFDNSYSYAVELEDVEYGNKENGTYKDFYYDEDDFNIVFWYQKEIEKPKLIYGNSDPNESPVPNYNQLKQKVGNNDPFGQSMNQLLYPNNHNSQYIAKESISNPVWVLDENGSLDIRFATSIATNPRFDVTLSFPFNVLYNNRLTKTISISNMPVRTFSIKGEEEYIGYHATINGIEIPISTIEKDYENLISGRLTFTCDELGDESIIGTEKASVTIVGAVYDFTVTNIDGSATTGDEIWKKSLFENGSVYKANNIPIGQGTQEQQDDKYGYGIKQGTRFYFSLNTKGAKTETIEILPKYYYYTKNGELKGEVELRDTSGKIIDKVRRTSIKDENRRTSEYILELQKGVSKIYPNVYSSSNINIGDFYQVNISKLLRTPFVNYGKNALDKEKYHEKSTISDTNLKYVSHWYADFSVPNSANYYLKNTNEKIKEDGYIVVCFMIKTKDEKGNDYLAYNLESPFNQNTKESEWKYEKGNTSNVIIFPDEKEANEIWNILLTGSDALKVEGYAPVIIYQSNVSTKQNVDSVGTH